MSVSNVIKKRNYGSLEREEVDKPWTLWERDFYGYHSTDVDWTLIRHITHDEAIDLVRSGTSTWDDDLKKEAMAEQEINSVQFVPNDNRCAKHELLLDEDGTCAACTKPFDIKEIERKIKTANKQPVFYAPEVISTLVIYATQMVAENKRLHERLNNSHAAEAHLWERNSELFNEVQRLKKELEGEDKQE